MKFSWKSYYAPTPKRLRVLGDTLLSTAMVASTFSVFMEKNIIALVVAIVGCLGKFVSNFFSEDNIESNAEGLNNGEGNEAPKEEIIEEDKDANTATVVLSTRVTKATNKRLKAKAKLHNLNVSSYIKYIIKKNV